MPVFRFLLAWIVSPVLTAQTVLIVQEGPGKVVVFSAADAGRRTAIPVGSKPHEIEVTPDGRTAYVSNFGLLEGNHKAGIPGTSISVLDVAGRMERTRFRLPPGSTAPHGLKLRPPHHRELFTNAEEGSEAMIVFDADSGAVLRTFPLPPGVHNFVFNADGSALFAFTMQGEVCRMDAVSGRLVARVRTGSPRGLAWTAGSPRLIVSGKNEILLLDPERLLIEKRIDNLGVGQIFYPAATPDGRRILAPAVLDGVVLVIDAATGRVEQRIETGSPLLIAIPDSKHAWVANVLIPPDLFGPGIQARDGGVVLLDLTTLKATPIPGIPDANGLAVVPGQ
jgi:DNA-binding beta-propeller fold protein YncE